MSAQKTTIKVPEAYQSLIEDLRLLKRDGQNPNKMTIKQKAQTWHSLEKYGWIFPIVTNKHGMLTDGEQRVDVCLAHNEYFAPVLRLPIEDVDRRMLRQILNKLKGTHDKTKDQEEYLRIIQLNGEAELKALLDAQGEKMPNPTEEETEYLPLKETWELIIECEDEIEQQTAFNKLSSEGYKVKVLSL